MRIFYIGEVKSIIRNLEELDAEIVYAIPSKFDGIIVTANLVCSELDFLKEFHKPIVVSGNPRRRYKNIDVLILNEDEVEIFYRANGITSLQSCKDKLRNLKIKYLVVSLGKDKIKECITYNLPSIKASDIEITNKEVEQAKDVLTAVLGYTYIKEGKLTPKAIERANIGASLSTVDDSTKIKDYYLGINLKRRF